MKTIQYPPYPVLLVDDEEVFLESCAFTLRAVGINNVIVNRHSREVIPLLSAQEIEIILLDITMPHLSGKDLFPKIVQEFPDIPIIMLTGVNDVKTAVENFKTVAATHASSLREEMIMKLTECKP